jgi:hypothetical protein
MLTLSCELWNNMQLILSVFKPLKKCK